MLVQMVFIWTSFNSLPAIGTLVRPADSDWYKVHNLKWMLIPNMQYLTIQIFDLDTWQISLFENPAINEKSVQFRVILTL